MLSREIGGGQRLSHDFVFFKSKRAGVHESTKGLGSFRLQIGAKLCHIDSNPSELCQHFFAVSRRHAG